MQFFKQSQNGILLSIFLQPGAKREGPVGPYNNQLKWAVREHNNYSRDASSFKSSANTGR